MATRYSPRIVTDGLVALWDAKNSKSYPGTGDDWTDLIGGLIISKITGAGSGLPSFNSEGTFTFVQDGGYFELTNASIALTTELTLLSWYKQTATSSPYPRAMECHITGASSGSQSHALAMGGTNDYDIRGWWDQGGTSSDRIGEVAAIVNTQDEWHCIASTYSSPDGILYLDGEEIDTSSEATTGLDDINTIAFGNIPGSGNNLGDFEGEMSYHAIYNKALTAAEILQNFNALKGRYGL